MLTQKFELIEFTKELSNVTGCLWRQSITSGKGIMNDMLLMHTFHSKGYLLPEYLAASSFDTKGANTGYQGGHVIEPKKGIYKNVVLLLDFNSLYPSIIREFDICFSTVPREKMSYKQVAKGEKIQIPFLDVD